MNTCGANRGGSEGLGEKKLVSRAKHLVMAVQPREQCARGNVHKTVTHLPPHCSPDPLPPSRATAHHVCARPGDGLVIILGNLILFIHREQVRLRVDHALHSLFELRLVVHLPRILCAQKVGRTLRSRSDFVNYVRSSKEVGSSESFFVKIP